ncbi:MAG: hypothetical protein AAGA54_27525 [Myxococcota bacterium]
MMSTPFHSFDDDFLTDQLLVVTLILAFGPVIGITMLIKWGPMVVDPIAETLTYRSRVIPFFEQGLVRIITTKTHSASASSYGGVSTRRVDIELVTSGEFSLSPDDALPRFGCVRLANRLNDAIAEYDRRTGASPSTPATTTAAPRRPTDGKATGGSPTDSAS